MAGIRIAASGQKSLAARRGTVSWAWIGLLPFLLFAFAFLLLPSATILVGSFQDAHGQFTLENFSNLLTPTVVHAYSSSLQLSLITAVTGGILGFLIAYAITLGGLPKLAQTAVIAIAAVASNFAGVPLAFAFVSILGRTGFLTGLLKAGGFNLYDHGFNLYSLAGLSLTYIYFLFPLMIMLLVSSLEGMKREWREAAENLGASSVQYWRNIGLPILLPAVLGTMILLFGSSFGAYATAYALTGGQINLITLQISSQLSGDVFNNPGAGYVMALGMVIIMALSLGLYTVLQRRTEKWLR